MPQIPKYKLKNSDFDNKQLGNNIAKIRKSKGITQTEIAENIGITQKLVSDYEVGRVKLSAEMLFHFAVALDISTDELLNLNKTQVGSSDLSLRFTRRIRELDELPENKKKAILQVLDDLIRANS